MNQDNQQVQLYWEAPEFRHYEKNTAWYATFVIISVLIVGFFLIQKDIFGAITMAILAGLVAFFSRQRPTIVPVMLNDKGIKCGNVFYPYKQIRHFWIVNDQTHKTVNFHTTALLNNTVILELEDQDPEYVRQFLLRYLPEHDDDQGTLIQRIAHKIKF